MVVKLCPWWGFGQGQIFSMDGLVNHWSRQEMHQGEKLSIIEKLLGEPWCIQIQRQCPWQGTIHDKGLARVKDGVQCTTNLAKVWSMTSVYPWWENDQVMHCQLQEIDKVISIVHGVMLSMELDGYCWTCPLSEIVHGKHYPWWWLVYGEAFSIVKYCLWWVIVLGKVSMMIGCPC